MLTAVPNSGIFNDDSLDRMRGEALADAEGGLPESVVYYLRALEARLLDAKAEQKRRSLRDIAWKFAPQTTPPTPGDKSREEPK